MAPSVRTALIADPSTRSSAEWIAFVGSTLIVVSFLVFVHVGFSGAHAILISTPEYNYGPPPALINALDQVYVEWNYKPVGLVTYGGISGGLVDAIPKGKERIRAQHRARCRMVRDARLVHGEKGRVDSRHLARTDADGRDLEIGRLKAKVGELTMTTELLEAKIERLEGGRPLMGRRSRS